MRSTAPVWMSNVWPRRCIDMAEHSRCQPGRPSPIAVGHDGSPSFFAFQRTKSRALSFSYSSLSTREKSLEASTSTRERLPYGGNVFTRKYVEPSATYVCPLLLRS